MRNARECGVFLVVVAGQYGRLRSSIHPTKRRPVLCYFQYSLNANFPHAQVESILPHTGRRTSAMSHVPSAAVAHAARHTASVARVAAGRRRRRDGVPERLHLSVADGGKCVGPRSTFLKIFVRFLLLNGYNEFIFIHFIIYFTLLGLYCYHTSKINKYKILLEYILTLNI